MVDHRVMSTTKYHDTTNTNTSFDLLLQRAKAILMESDTILEDAMVELQQAKALVSTVGLKIEDSCIIEKPVIVTTTTTTATTTSSSSSSSNGGRYTNHNMNNDGTTKTIVPSTTGGFSNTDHIITVVAAASSSQSLNPTTGNTIDRVSELKRNLIRRHRYMHPEHRMMDQKWDKPKAPGERRRKIVLAKDVEELHPPEPPYTGWSIFVGQMTTKFRHDDPQVHHDQSKILKTIATMWKQQLTESQRKHYDDFASQAKQEYQRQLIEYRATGTHQPSARFKALENTNIWVNMEQPCELEKEIMSYDTVKFPPRPPELDEEYEERQTISILKRKLRARGWMDHQDNLLKKDIDFDTLLETERQSRKQRRLQKQQQQQQQIMKQQSLIKNPKSIQNIVGEILPYNNTNTKEAVKHDNVDDIQDEVNDDDYVEDDESIEKDTSTGTEEPTPKTQIGDYHTDEDNNDDDEDTPPVIKNIVAV